MNKSEKIIPFDSDFTGGCANRKKGLQIIPPDFSVMVCMIHGSWRVAEKDPCSLMVL